MEHPVSSEVNPETAKPLQSKPLAERAEEEKSPGLRDQLRIAFGIAESVKKSGGKALVVGGFARDEALRLMGRDVNSKDVDLEIYGIGPEKILSMLNRFGKPDLRGEQFAIVNVGGVDISIPRRESKAGPGHRGFKIEGDPRMTFREASRRRDFTVNAIAIAPESGNFIDEWDGLNDLERGVLRAIDKSSFADDPLRPLRAAQLAARFGFSVEPKTVELCRSVNLRELPRERVGEEWLKLLRSPRPSLGLNAVAELEVLDQLHPDLKGVSSDRKRWEHLCRAADAAAIVARERDLDNHRVGIFVLSALCLSLGEQGTERLLSQLNVSVKITREILPLVKMYPPELKRSDEAIRRLAVALYPSSIEEFYWVLKADNGGEPTKLSGEMLRKAELLGVEKRPTTPLLSGDFLLELGVPEGAKIGMILDAVFEAQLKGKVADLEGARQLAKKLWGK